MVVETQPNSDTSQDSEMIVTGQLLLGFSKFKMSTVRPCMELFLKNIDGHPDMKQECHRSPIVSLQHRRWEGRGRPDVDTGDRQARLRGTFWELKSGSIAVCSGFWLLLFLNFGLSPSPHVIRDPLRQ